MALMTCPTCRITTIPPQFFRVTLLRRLCLPLHLTVRSCQCGRSLDAFRHHHAACAQVGVSGKRGWDLENVAARICREAGGRVSTNISMRNLDLARPSSMVEGSKSSLMVCHFMVVPNLPLTRHWFVFSKRDGTPDG